MSEMTEILDLGFKVLAISGCGAVIFKLGKAMAKFEEITTNQASSIEELKDDVQKLNTIVVDMALHNQRLDLLSQQLNHQNKLIDELRHGEGFIMPLRGT